MTNSHLKKTPKTVAAVGIVFLSIGLSACGEPESAEVPDVLGIPGDEARDSLEEAAFDADMNALDGSAVFSPGNWEVESTDPEGGEPLPEGEEVTLNLVRPADDEETPEPEEDEDSSTEFEFITEDLDFGTQVLVRWDIETGLTGGMTEQHAESDAFEALQQAAEYEPDYDRIALNGYTETVDEYGNKDTSLAIIAGYDRETVEQINFDNTDNVDLWSINDSGGGCIPCE